MTTKARSKTITAPEQMRVGQHGGQQQRGKRIERKLQTVSTYSEPSFWRHFAILCQGNKLVVNHYIVIFLIMNVSAVIVKALSKRWSEKRLSSMFMSLLSMLMSLLSMTDSHEAPCC